jgi:Domain of unknown function (DUF4232)
MRSRATVLVVAVVAALAAVTTISATSYPPGCNARQLRGRVAGSSGAAGTIVLSLTLTNRGTTCSTKGYARLLLMASARRPLPTHVLHGGLAILNQRPRLVVLRHGGVATIRIAYSDVPTGTERSCPASSEILVRVPGDPTWLPVIARIRACNHGTLRESPILAGRRIAS